MTDSSGPSGSSTTLQPGDFCHHGQNALPLYRVIWVDDGRAWLRDVNTDADSVVQLGRCRACTPDGDEYEVSATPSSVTWPDGTPRP